MRFLSVLLLLSSLLFSVSPRITTTMSMQELNKLTASDGVDSDSFGLSVAISGDSVVVGAYRDDDYSGSAYIYERDTATSLFHQIAKLTASDGADYDRFGESVAISGDTVVVGASYDDNSGSAYIYEKPATGWGDSNQTAKLTASYRGINDRFGSSVAISGDTVVVGAHDQDSFFVNSGAVYIYEKPGTGWTDSNQSAKLKASDEAYWDRFGWSVSISGDTVVVGAYGNDDFGDSSGSIYIYEKLGSFWSDSNQERVKLTASDGAADDYFGESVAISGDTVVVGAYLDDDSGTDSGSAYIYERDTTTGLFQQTAKLTASDGNASDYFGESVAISGDTVVVGAYLDDDSGSAYIYERDSATGLFLQTAKLTASDGNASDWFGFSVAISGDTVVVGALYDDDSGTDSGSAYIFKNMVTQNSIENKKEIIDIEASDADGDYPIIFSILGGSDVSFFDIDASTGLLSFKVAPDFENPQDADANNTYEAIIKLTDDSGESDTYAVFIRVSDVAYEGPMPKAINFKELNKLIASNGEANNYFGTSVAISGDTVVVGAYGYDGSTGSAYIYEYNALSNQFEEVAQLTASDGNVGDWFGSSVAISGDSVVVGAYRDDEYSGSAYIYEKPGTGWVDFDQESAKLTASDRMYGASFGYSVAISGDIVVVGISDYGAYIYERDTATGLFQQTANLTASDGAAADYFAWSVAISGDTVVVGAWGDDDFGDRSGSAYLYEKPGTGWVDSNQESAKLTASDGAAVDFFGYSVAISGDTVVVGAYLDDDSGSAYIYEKPGTGWADSNQSAKLTASDGAMEDYFGKSVAISGDTVVVGAYGDGYSWDDFGSAYIYEKPGTGWADSNQSAKLTASDRATDDHFANSVAISGDTIVVGAKNDDTDTLGDESGSAYVFKAKASAVNPAIIMYLLN